MVALSSSSARLSSPVRPSRAALARGDSARLSKPGFYRTRARTPRRSGADAGFRSARGAPSRPPLRTASGNSRRGPRPHRAPGEREGKKIPPSRADSIRERRKSTGYDEQVGFLRELGGTVGVRSREGSTGVLVAVRCRGSRHARIVERQPCANARLAACAQQSGIVRPRHALESKARRLFGLRTGTRRFTRGPQAARRDQHDRRNCQPENAVEAEHIRLSGEDSRHPSTLKCVMKPRAGPRSAPALETASVYKEVVARKDFAHGF